jgi:hypothetical protein
MSEIENKPRKEEQTTIGVSRETLAHAKLFCKFTRRLHDEMLSELFSLLAHKADEFQEGQCNYWLVEEGDKIIFQFYGKKKMQTGVIHNVPVDAEDPKGDFIDHQ